ncbi:altered inheritance of mitochondria protein 31, mitochondrial [Thelonectria olida]|uniref:Altered inheritance of mitochondria protein 31, mitochondrial n=1 Tax=Thelonectria olida TaxID=1576542 RepID=A0A9P8WH97_9HYPO|nr:altered inheritance of mitochondria protein 31, mitochondrial [Thelonectria olida]
MADGPPQMPGPLPSSFDDNQEFYNERPMHKVLRKIKEEPLIPLGIGLTTLAFINAYRALRRGDSKQANRMFRARVAAQGFTVIAMVAGSMYYNKDREKTKELRKLKEQRDAEEKRLKWIRELEVRDEEEKALKAHLERKRQQAATGATTTDTPSTSQTEGTEAGATAGTGGVLGRMGLWPKEEKTAGAEETAEVKDSASENQERKKNPKSSLGDLGEIISTQKKD